MKTLVIAEIENKELNPITLNALTAAKCFTNECDILMAGKDIQKVSESIAKVDGVKEIFSYDDLSDNELLAEHLAQLVVDKAQDYDVVLAASSTFSKNLLPRVAAILDVALVSDVVEIVDKNIFKRPVYAGNLIQTVESLDSKKLLTVRATAFDKAEIGQNTAPVQTLQASLQSFDVRFLNQSQSESIRPELSRARIVVSGGRGLKNKENFALVEQLADKLGAAVGASRAAVDAGYISNDHQVGQTGKIVAPELYIALGISGAIQHLAGMKDSKVIVAINKDEQAPLCQIADYCLIGDLFELVPELIAALPENRREK